MDSERVGPAPASTGDPRVDAAIGPLSSLEDVELAERPAVLEAVHDRLREILGELGDAGRPGPGGPGEPGRPGEQDELGELGAGVLPRPGQPPKPGQPAPGQPGASSWPRRPHA